MLVLYFPRLLRHSGQKVSKRPTDLTNVPIAATSPAASLPLYIAS